MSLLRHLALLVIVTGAACRSGADGEEPTTKPLVQGFYRVDRVDSPEGTQSMEEIFGASIENRDGDSPEFLMHRLSVEFDGSRVTAGSDLLLATHGDRFPFATCSVRVTAEPLWRGDTLEVPATVRASDVVRIFDNPAVSSDSTEVTCSVRLEKSAIQVETDGETVKLHYPGGILVLVPDDRDPKFEAHLP